MTAETFLATRFEKPVVNKSVEIEGRGASTLCIIPIITLIPQSKILHILSIRVITEAKMPAANVDERNVCPELVEGL
jgi:hypothetical protein